MELKVNKDSRLSIMSIVNILFYIIRRAQYKLKGIHINKLFSLNNKGILKLIHCHNFNSKMEIKIMELQFIIAVPNQFQPLPYRYSCTKNVDQIFLLFLNKTITLSYL
jgi:hypothetical protein